MATKVKLEYILLGLIIVAGYGLYAGWWTANIGGTTLQTTNPGQTGTQVVTKPVKLALMDKYGGGPIVSATVTIYDASMNQVESLTSDGSTGIATTSSAYSSGTVLWVKTYKSSNTEWFKVVVPTLSAADAQSLSTIGPLTLMSYQYTALGALTLTNQAGTAYVTTNNYNYTTTGKNPVFTIQGHEPTDGKGFISSYDPIYGLQGQAVLVVLSTGTNYDKIQLTGFDGSITRGSNVYYYKILSDDQVSKWKVGNTYRFQGAFGVNFPADFTSGGTGSNLQFFVYFNADPAYFQQTGSWGPNAVSAATAFQLNISG